MHNDLVSNLGFKKKVDCSLPKKKKLEREKKQIQVNDFIRSLPILVLVEQLERCELLANGVAVVAVGMLYQQCDVGVEVLKPKGRVRCHCCW